MAADKWISPESFVKIFPFFRKGSQGLAQDLLSCGQYQAFPSNTVLQLEGQPCNGAEFQLSGVKRAYKASESGRRITLYEVFPGEVCVVNFTCALLNSVSPINSVSVTDMSMLSISPDDIRKLLAKYEKLSTFIFAAVNQRFGSLIEISKEIAFRRMDERLFDYLVEKSENRKLSTTHQRIADDLGTAREVISRLLKEFEKKGILRLSRNLIELTHL